MGYEVKVMWSRGEVEFLDLTPFVTAGKWTRKLDTWDEALVKFGPVSSSCCSELAGVRPWLHELAIFQDGELQFVGPIITPAPGTTGQIDARGMAHWFDVRFVRDSIDTTGAGVPASDIVQFIIDSALSASDPNLSNFITVDECTMSLERKIDVTNEPVVAWSEQLADIVGTYMHMSSYGRQLRFWCAKNPCLQELASLGRDDFVSNAPVTFDGETFATRAAVWNNKSSTGTGTEAPVVGYYGGLNSYDILVERKFLDSSVTSASSAAAGAKTHVRDLPALVAGQQIGDDVQLELARCSDVKSSRLQVGSCMTVAFANACAELTAFVRLEEITGTWDAKGEKTTVQFAEQPNAGQLSLV